MNPDDPIWVPSVFSKNRERLIDGGIADAFLQDVLWVAETHGLLSHEHFTVDSTLLDAWASQKSVQSKDPAARTPSDDGDPKNPTINFRHQRRPNETHESTTDPDARLARKSRGTASIVGYLGSVLMDNRHGLIVATDVRAPGYDRERDAALEMLTTLDPRARRRTLGADNGYDTPTFVEGVRACGGTPRVAQNVHARKSRSAIDERTTRHDGYAVSQQQRKLVEESLGWGKVVGGLRKLHHRGRRRVDCVFRFVHAAYNPVRIRTLLRRPTCASRVAEGRSAAAPRPNGSHWEPPCACTARPRTGG